jgi:hypothetical protein
MLDPKHTCSRRDQRGPEPFARLVGSRANVRLSVSVCLPVCLSVC